MAKFERGQLVGASGCIVLVTGEGKKDEDYNTFSGVVVLHRGKHAKKDWPIGMYSRTWLYEAFRKLDIELTAIIKKPV